MTASPLEDAMRRVLNDRRIFWMPQELIGKAGWATLRNALDRDDSDTALGVVASAKGDIDKRINAERDARRKQHLEDARQLLNGLEAKIKQAPSSINRVLDLMESFGPVRCNLPDTEDMGKVIEGYGRPTVEEFFTYKIQKERDQQRQKALVALFEEVRRLYDLHVEPLEIAFFVRKIDSLNQIVEVLR